MDKPFKEKCPYCGKKVVVMIPNKKAFCSKVCETNYKYSDRFADDRYFKNTPMKE
jgi:rRNA maturation protein Nop10